MPDVDWSMVERIWEARLRQRGLTPLRSEDAVATGLEGFEIRRLETQFAEFQLENPPRSGCLASLEVGIRLKLPAAGEFELRDLITQRGESVEGALEVCAHTFVDVTFPPLETLFTGRRPEGPGTGRLTLHSYTPGTERGIAWDVVLGPMQILGDPQGLAREKLRASPPVTLMLDSLLGQLSAPRLHWCKLYGASFPEAELRLGCAIDGLRSPQAEAELVRKFGAAPPGEWEFRQFFVVRPTGETDAAMTAELKRLHRESSGTGRSLWSRLFGR